MKRLPYCTFVAALIGWLIGTPLATAQTSAEWVIRGVVKDAGTGDPLPGATLVLLGQYVGTSTDVNGEFRLGNIGSDSIRVEVKYLGFRSDTISFIFPADHQKFREVMLRSMSTSLATVEISTTVDGQQRALNQQRASDNIINVISADQIGKFPDLNVAEALQRVPGINIQRDKGEGSTVTIRGTPQHFTSISINGEQIPSVRQDGVRTEALDLIPADQLGSMEITKAITSDMDGDAIGGNINLRTPTARNTDLDVRAEAGVGYNDLSGGLNGIGRLRVGRRFFETEEDPRGKLGVLVGASYFATDNSEDRIDSEWAGNRVPIQDIDQDTIVMNGYEFRKTENNRTRIGATAALDYRFNKNNSIIFNYMYNFRSDDDVRNRMRFDLDRSNTTFFALDSIGDGRVRRDINLWNEEKSNHNFNLEGLHRIGKWSVDWGAFLTLSRRGFTSTRGDFSRDEVGIRTLNSEGIYSDVPQFDLFGPVPTLHDPLLLNDFRRYEEDEESTEGQNQVLKFNISRGFTLFGHKGLFKAGAKARMQSNTKFRNNVVFAWNDPNNILNLPEAFADVISDNEPIEYLNGRFRFGPRVDPTRFTDFIDQNRRFLTIADDAWDSRRLSLSDTYDAFEDIYSGYMMARLQVKKLMILAGVRYEDNSVFYEAFDVFREGTTVVAEPIDGGSDYGFLLPNLHLKYSLNDLTNLRFAYTQSYSRPNFVDLVPFVAYDADAISLRLGNPDLQPSLANNLDVMYERYFSNAGIISLGAFYKHLDRFQFTRGIPALAEDYPGYPGTAGFQFEQEQNGEEAEVYGLEINAVRSLTMLPGILSGTSIIVNYTFTQSEAFTQDRTGITLPGQAPHTLNASLAYEYKGFSARFNANFNGEFTETVAGSENDDVVQASRWQFDANINQQLTKRLSVYAEFVNITNSPSIRYQGIRERIARIAYFGWWSRVGVSFRL